MGKCVKHGFYNPFPDLSTLSNHTEEKYCVTVLNWLYKCRTCHRPFHYIT